MVLIKEEPNLCKASLKAGLGFSSFLGGYAKKIGVYRINNMGCSLFILAWLILLFFDTSYWGIIGELL